jgi:signal transduction histidine kinase
MVRRHTILVVDDEADVVQSVQDLLRLDYRVIGKTRTGDAIRVLQEQEIHIVMTDQRMPDMTGVQFLCQVRGDCPDAIRLLFTGYADIKAVIDAINQGSVYRYITKPWDPDELQTVIRQAAEQYDLLLERKRLLRELQLKNEELQKANAELKHANALREAFIRVASHELRTPLTILYGLTQLALRTPNVASPLREWLASTHRASERLNYLVDQLIKMLSAGRFDRPLERRPVDLGALVRQAAQDVLPFVEQRGQDLLLDLASDLGSIDGDAGKIRDSLDNLLLNAIKFTPDGGRIQVAAQRNTERAAEIRVTDSGTGIDPAIYPYLFQPFFTGFDVSRHSSGHFEFGRQGLGLGLSLAKAFVEMHGGALRVESEQGKGSTFTITLPQQAGSDGSASLGGASRPGR